MRKEYDVHISKIMPEVRWGETVGQEYVMCRFKWDYPIVNLMSGHVRVCCRVHKQVITEDDLQKHGTDAIMNLPYEKERRLEKLKGITHKDCESCIRLEHNHADSPRSGTGSFIDDYWNHKRAKVAPTSRVVADFKDLTEFENLTLDSPLVRSDHPEMLEIVLGNTCDLKCTYCSVHYSSQWANELVQFGEMSPEVYAKEFPKAPPSLEKVFWEWFYDVGRYSVETINILGGEPTYMSSFYTTMEKLNHAYADMHKKPDWIVELGVLSNMNTQEKNLRRFIGFMPELAKHFRLRLQPSIEAMGERAEYIRFNLSWDRLVYNVRTVLTESKKLGLTEDQFMMGFQTAINTFSISSLPNFIHWVNQLNKEFNVELGLMKNVVSFPRHHNPNILTPDFARYIDSAIEYVEMFEHENDNISRRQRGYGSWHSYRNDLLLGLQRTIGSHVRSSFDLDSRIAFYEFVKRNDERRNISFLKTYPEYTEFYQLCQKAAEERMQ